MQVYCSRAKILCSCSKKKRAHLRKVDHPKLKSDDHCQRDWLAASLSWQHVRFLLLNLKPLIKWMLGLTTTEHFLCSCPHVASWSHFQLTVMHTQIFLLPYYQWQNTLQHPCTKKKVFQVCNKEFGLSFILPFRSDCLYKFTSYPRVWKQLLWSKKKNVMVYKNTLFCSFWGMSESFKNATMFQWHLENLK